MTATARSTAAARARTRQTAGGNGGAGDDMPGIDQTAARPRTLREHLIEQIGADLPDIADRAIAFYLLDQLDENGYLRIEIEAAERALCRRRGADSRSRRVGRAGRRRSPGRRCGKVRADLLDQMLAQGARPGRGLVESGQVARPPPLPPAVLSSGGLETSRHHLSPAATQWSAASPATSPSSPAGIASASVRVIHSLLTGSAAAAGPSSALALSGFEQRVLLDLAIDELCQLDIRQLQHLDRLLQLQHHAPEAWLSTQLELRKTDLVQSNAPVRSGLIS